MLVTPKIVWIQKNLNIWRVDFYDSLFGPIFSSSKFLLAFYDHSFLIKFHTQLQLTNLIYVP